MDDFKNKYIIELYNKHDILMEVFLYNSYAEQFIGLKKLLDQNIDFERIETKLSQYHKVYVSNYFKRKTEFKNSLCNKY